MLSWIRGLASEPWSRVLHGQFSKNLPSLTMHGLDLTMPRGCARQVHRPNVGGPIEEYYRRTIYVPYLDSLIQSLESRFGESNTQYFHIFALHPREMQQTERDEFKHIVSSVKEMYGIVPGSVTFLACDLVGWGTVLPSGYTQDIAKQGIFDIIV